MRLTLIIASCISILSADEWQDQWIKGRLEYQNDHYQDALIHFESASKSAPMQAEVKLDYAESLYALGHLKEAREMLSEAALCPKGHSANIDEQIRVLNVFIAAALNDKESYNFYLDEFEKNYIYATQIYRTSTHVYIINCGPGSLRDAMQRTLEVTDGIEKIEWLEGIGIARKKPDCACGCKDSVRAPTQKELYENCKNSCDEVSIVAQAWCSKMFKSIKCRAACLYAVKKIKEQLCYRCCQKASENQQTCLDYFLDITSNMGAPCYRGETDDEMKKPCLECA